MAIVNHNDNTELTPGKLNEEKKTPPPRTISKIIFIGFVLGGVAMAAIALQFDGLIEFKLGIEGGQILIDGRNLPPSKQ